MRQVQVEKEAEMSRGKEVWTTKDGKRIPVREMGDLHLLNAYRKIQVSDGSIDPLSASSVFSPDSEAAYQIDSKIGNEDIFDQSLAGSDPMNRWRRILKREIKRRGLTPLRLPDET